MVLLCVVCNRRNAGGRYIRANLIGGRVGIVVDGRIEAGALGHDAVASTHPLSIVVDASVKVCQPRNPSNTRSRMCYLPHDVRVVIRQLKNLPGLVAGEPEASLNSDGA